MKTFLKLTALLIGLAGLIAIGLSVNWCAAVGVFLCIWASNVDNYAKRME